MERSSRSVPTGPGSRGGTYHLDRAAYDREWRAAHPEYREREALRMARKRAVAHNEDPTLVTVSFHLVTRLTPATFCRCGCWCRVEVVQICGFCQDGLHG